MLPCEDGLRHFGDAVRQDERVWRWNGVAVHGEQPAPHEERVAGDANDTLHERRCDLVRGDSNRCVLRRRDENGDITAFGAGVAGERVAREWDVRSEAKLVDEEPVADEQSRLHATARYAEGFSEELARAEDDGNDRQEADYEGARAGCER